jgi:hypothetical protein
VKSHQSGWFSASFRDFLLCDGLVRSSSFAVPRALRFGQQDGCSGVFSVFQCLEKFPTIGKTAREISNDWKQRQLYYPTPFPQI